MSLLWTRKGPPRRNHKGSDTNHSTESRKSHHLPILTLTLLVSLQNRGRGERRQRDTDPPTPPLLLEHPAPRDTQPPFPFSHWNLLQKRFVMSRSCHGTAAKQYEVNQRRTIMYVSTSTGTLHAVSSSAFSNRRLHKSRVLAVAFHHGHRCSKSNQLPRTNEILSCAVRSSCAMLHHSNLGLHLDHPSPHNKFRTTRPVLHPASIVPDIELQPFSQEFSCHDDFLHAVEFPHVVCGDLDAARTSFCTAQRWACSSIMDAVFILFWRHQHAVVQWFECVFADILGIRILQSRT